MVNNPHQGSLADANNPILQMSSAMQQLITSTIGALRENFIEFNSLDDMQIHSVFGLYSREIQKTVWSDTYISVLMDFRSWFSPYSDTLSTEKAESVIRSLPLRKQFLEIHHSSLYKLKDGDGTLFMGPNNGSFYVYRCRTAFVVFSVCDFTGALNYRGSVSETRISHLFDIMNSEKADVARRQTDPSLIEDFKIAYAKTLSRLSHGDSIVFPEFGDKGAEVVRCKQSFIVFRKMSIHAPLCFINGVRETALHDLLFVLNTEV